MSQTLEEIKRQSREQQHDTRQAIIAGLHCPRCKKGEHLIFYTSPDGTREWNHTLGPLVSPCQASEYWEGVFYRKGCE